MKYLKQIPKGWNEVKVKDYIRLTELIDGDTDSTEIIEAAFYVFTGVPMVDSNIKIDETNAIVDRLLFIAELPKESKVALKLKKFSELNYQEYITFQKLAESPVDNLIPIVQIFCKEPIDESTITIDTAMGCFFLLKRRMNKRLIFLGISLMWQTMMKIIKTSFKKILHKLGMKDNKGGVGY